MIQHSPIVQSVSSRATLAGIVLVWGLLTAAPPTHAFGLSSYLMEPDYQWGFINNRQIYRGHVYARGVYQTEDGNPVYVEYNDEGQEVAEIGEVTPDSQYAHARVIAASEYQAYIQQYETELAHFRDIHPNTPDPELLTAEQYENRLQSLKTATSPAEPWQGDPATHKLNASTHSVMVVPESILYTPESRYLLEQFPVDLRGGLVLNLDELESILIGKHGKVLYTSENRIGYRAVFYENTAATSADERFGDSAFVTSAKNANGDSIRVMNPLPHVAIEAPVGYGRFAATNADGRYGMTVMGTPCPGFNYFWDNFNLTGWIPYRAFNPDLASMGRFPISRTAFFGCLGLVTRGQPIPLTHLPDTIDFQLDLTILSGSLSVPGVGLAEDSRSHPLYDLEVPDSFIKATSDYHDFDLDGVPDVQLCGGQNDEGHFIPETDCQNTDLQGVYLSSQLGEAIQELDVCLTEPTNPICQPQFLRVIDTEANRTHQGLVSKLTSDHLQDTDIFVIRQSNGQLVAQRQGLKQSEGAYEPASGGTGVVNDLYASEDELRADYRMLMRGDEHYANQGIHGVYNARTEFGDWQISSGMAPELQQYQGSDLVQPGETLEIWAINRVTGYVGKADVIVGEGMTVGSVETLVPDITLRPPNLKIWAERRYTIEAGKTQDEQRDYLISHEGAGEGDDTFIQLFVEWLDQDGSAIPDALKDYGYTGRLAYVSSENTLSDASQAGQARFDIQPGKHSELLRLPNIEANNLHYYVQVNGIPYNDFTDFALGTQSRNDEVSFEGTEENDYRPARFVPIQVPQYDEEASTLQHQVYLTEKKRRAEAGTNLTDLSKPIPLHRWHYRPEYQFSVYDLEIDSINLVGADEENPDEDLLIDIKDDPSTSIADNSVLALIYSLQGSDENLLPSLDGDQTLILGVGQQEVNVTLTDNHTLRFDDLSYLNQLGSNDYLTIALYTNEDAGNLLWQYAFGRSGLRVYYQIPHEPIEMHNQTPPSVQEGDTQARRLVRTLGGMRLKYRYEPPTRPAPPEADTTDRVYVDVESVQWQFEADGWMCHVGGTGYDDCWYVPEGSVYDQTQPREIEGNPNPEWSIWWEPADPEHYNSDEALRALWTTDLNVKAQYTATLEDLPPETGKFRIVTREIEPDEEPLQGSDVAMLEQLLWQLGLSPQKSGGDNSMSGSEGARINSNRNGNPEDGVTTAPCLDQEQSRQNYLSGWRGCDTGDVATEGMVRRFQGRSFDEGNLGGNQNTPGLVDGNVGNSTLAQLQRVWRHYTMAYDLYSGDSDYTLADIPEGVRDHLLELAESGGTVDYTYTGDYSVEATLTEDELNQITAEFPEEAQAFTRWGLFNVWIHKESGRVFWGENPKSYQTTPFRIYEGGAEEKGSMGFNQIVWQRTYGPENACKGVAGYLTEDNKRVDPTESEDQIKDNVNQYNPKDNLLSFLVALTDPECRYTRGLYNAYNDNSGTSYQTDIPEADRPYAYCYEIPGNDTSCAEQEQTDNLDNPINRFNSTEDDGLELLGKAVIAYNHGAGDLDVEHYFGEDLMLRSTPRHTGTNFHYWLKIKELSQTLDDVEGYIPFVSYIWVGARYPDTQIVDGEEVPHPQAGEPEWCFLYGEREWMNDIEFSDAYRETRRYRLGVEYEDDVNREVTCQ